MLRELKAYSILRPSRWLHGPWNGLVECGMGYTTWGYELTKLVLPSFESVLGYHRVRVSAGLQGKETVREDETSPA